MKQQELVGRVLDSFQLPVAIRFVIAAPALCGTNPVGEGGSDHDGRFAIALSPTNASRAFLQLYHCGPQAIAKREIDLRKLPGELVIQLTPAEDPFTEYERSVHIFIKHLGEFDVGKLCPESAEFISRESGLPLAWATALAATIKVACLHGAKTLHGSERDPFLQALYALARKRPSDSMLAGGPAAWRRVVSAAAKGKQISPIEEKELCAVIDALRKLAVREEHEKPPATGNLPVVTILGTTSIDPRTRDELVAKYVERGGSVDAMLDGIDGDLGVELRATFSGARLAHDHLPLLAVLQRERVSAHATDWRHLARRTTEEWNHIVATTGVPDSMFGATVEEKQKLFIRLVERRAEAEHPGTALAAALRRAPGDQDESALYAILDSSEGDALVSKRTTNDTTELPQEGKALVRMYNVASTSDEAVVLYRKKYRTATSIKATGEDAFVASLIGVMPVARAKEIYRFAEQQSNVAEAALLRLHDRAIADVPFAIGEQGQASEYRALFGNLDHCECQHCSSLVGPAAYLVDIFAFLHGLEDGAPLERLFVRRDDLRHIKLDCANSHTLLPYIDLVNEILENAVAPVVPPARQTTKKEPELAAEPEHLSRAAYDRLLATGRLQSWRLPFDLWEEETRAYLGAIDVPRHRLLALGGADESVVVAERLGIGSLEAQILTGTTSHPVSAFWARPGTTTLPAEVATILRVARMTYRELAALGETTFVGVLDIQGESTCDTSKMRLPATGLESKLDRIHRFVRLQRHLGWMAPEVDRAIALLGAGRLDPAFLSALADARELASELGWTHSQALDLFDPNKRGAEALAGALSITADPLAGFIAVTGSGIATPSETLELVRRARRVRASSAPIEVWHYVLDATPLGDEAAPDEATIARHLDEVRRELQPLDPVVRSSALAEILSTSLALRVPVIEALFAAHPELSTPFLAAAFIDSPRDEHPNDSGAFAPAFAAYCDLHRAGTAVTALGATLESVAWMFAATPPSAAERFLLLSPAEPSTELEDWGLTAEQVARWAQPATFDIAAEIKAETRGRFKDDEWAVKGREVRDPLREKQAAALTDYLLADPPGTLTWRDSNDVYAYYLVDPEMSACCLISRIKLAHSSTQLFVQRCLLGLETPVAADAGEDNDWKQWEWRKNYRVWEAARRVILHPENYILHETLDRKTPLFKQLEKQLGQDDVTDETAEAAFRKYIDGLQEIANLEIAATSIEREGNGKEVVHVVGRTQSVPRRHYYRQRVTGDHGTWWTPWELVPVDIDGSDSLVIAVWNRKLWLLWTQLLERQDASESFTISDSGGTFASPSSYKELRLAWCTKTSTGWSDKSIQSDSIQRDLRDASVRGAVSRVRSDATPFLRAFPTRDELIIECDPMIRPFVVDPTVLGDSRVIRYRFASSGGPSTIEHAGEHVSVPPTWDYLAGGYRTEAVQVRSGNRRVDLIDVRPDAGTEWRLVPPHDAELGANAEVFASDHERAFFVDWSVDEALLESVREQAREGNIVALIVLALALEGTVSYRAELTSHPFARLFARELDRDGLPALFERALQLDPWGVVGGDPVSFESNYTPRSGSRTPLQEPYPLLDLDFNEATAFAQYNWELFFHAPMLIAERLSQNQRFAEAQRWFHRVFDPTQTNGTAPQRYWITRPFFELQRDGDTDRAIEELGEPGANHPELYRQVEAWEDDPFSVHRVARMRPVAYMKSVFMKYLDNLIAWGDALFRKDTFESINEAMQLYVLAADLLGPRPQEVTRSSPPTARSYAEIEGNLDALSNSAIENIEDRLLKRSKSKAAFLADKNTKKTAKLGGALAHLPLFCFPPNDKLLSYWDVISDRFFKIRHCQNIAGVERRLALFGSPVDPSLLVRARELGVDLRDALTGATAATPQYRFSVLVQHATQLCQETRGLGAALLSALEKRDAEELARLRANQEVQALDIVRATREHQVDEATEARDALLRTRESTTRRRDYYASRSFMNPAETAQQALVMQALALEVAAGGLDLVGNVLSLIPDVKIGAPFSMGATFGGSNIAPAVRAFGAFARSQSSVAGTQAQMIGTLASYQRRMDDWKLQKDLADDELRQLEHQIAAAELRLAVSKNELAAFERQLDNAEQTETILRDKYTNQELYDWMVGQVSAVHFQCYQLAYDACLRAARAFEYETQTTQTFIRPGYWDSLRSGLVAGDKLSFDLKRMEAAYLDLNRRDFEITKHISLAQVDPLALLALRRDGTCYVTFGEHLFERDFPGHVMRRIRALGVSIPSVAGPYVGINATVSLETSTVQTPNGPRAVMPPVATMVTSTGRDDMGLFEGSLRDERLVPFEGAGAVSQWRVQLPEVRSFDYDTISDVIFHVRYTARAETSTTPSPVPPPPDTTENRLVMLDVKQQFSTAWHRFLHVPEAGGNTLEIALGRRHVPFRLRPSFSISRFDFLLCTRENLGSIPELSIAVPGGATVPMAHVGTEELAGVVHFRVDVPDVPVVDDDATWRITASGLDTSRIEDGFVLLTY